MSYLKSGDTISGQEGTAFATIAGENHEMFYVRNIRATAEKKKTEIKTLGKRGTQQKASGWTGTGSMTVYYVTSRFRQMMLDYIKNGTDTYFDIMVTNNDPSSTVGKQIVTLINVNLNSVVMAALDTEADVLDEDIDFTYDDVDMAATNKFIDPTLG